MSDPLAIKLVVAPPSDTDPPTSAISITDNIVGINAPFTVVKDMPTPYDYGAAGDGVTDDTVAMQAWLTAVAGNAGYGASGTFLVSNLITIASGTTIWGSGRGTFIIKRDPGLDPFLPMIMNSSFGPTPGVFTNHDIAFHGCCFDGSSATMTVELVSMVGVQNLTFRDCLLQHCQHIGLAMANSRNVLVDGCEFFDWGNAPVTAGGGTAIWTNDSVFDVTIARNYFHDGEWTGIELSSRQSVVTGNHFRSCKEAAITGNAQFAVIANNVVEHVTKKFVAAVGFNLGGGDLVVNGNYISDTESESIHLVNVIDSTVSNNVCRLPGQDTSVPERACIGLISGNPTNTFNIEMRNVAISGNILSNEAGNAQRGIDLQLLGGGPSSPFAGPPMKDMMICNNSLSAFPWPEGDITIGDGVVGDRFCRKDNNDSVDRAPVVFSVAINPGDVAVPVVCGYTPSWIELKATIPGLAGVFGSFGQCAPSLSTGGPLVDNGHSSISFATDGVNSASNVSTDFCINVVDVTGAAICAAHVGSFDAGGFTLAIDSCSTTTQLLATCHR